MSATEDLTRRGLVMRAFSPAAPIADKTLFAGRTDQMDKLISISWQAGQHAAIYGERGVGKTSLARVMRAVMAHASWAGYYTCSSGDTFGSIWRGVLGTFKLAEAVPGIGFSGTQKANITTLADVLGAGEPSPNEVREVLELLAEAEPDAHIFIDEFDRPSDPVARSLFADTVKIISDQAIRVTLVFVGVADTIDELISEHSSIQRALVQIQMPRMTNSELMEIIHHGMRTANLKFDMEFARRVVNISQGLPHYTHLLAQHAGIHVVQSGRDSVRSDDFHVAVSGALNDASQTVREKYHRATYSNRENLYAQVLLACALAEKDDLGTFGAPDVRDKLSEITGRRYEIPAFANHLTNFSTEDGPRGGILSKRGTTRRFRYRFVDPLLPPYILMKGSHEQMIG